MFCLAAGAVGPAAALTAEAIAAARASWPAEVAVTAPARATVLAAGRPAGAMLLGAGRTLAVTEVTAEAVVGRIGGKVVSVPVDKTDLIARVERAGAAVPAAESAPAVAAPEVAKAPREAEAAAGPAGLARMLEGRLVRLDGRKVRAAPAGAVNGARLVALYYSASWCGPCKQFTPQLVSAYRELKAKHPEFEVVFVSSDRSEGAMEDYMKDDGMPWLAVDYDRRDEKLMGYCGPGIPCLVLVNEHGRVLSDSFVGDNYRGPQAVLADARRMLAGR